MKKEAELPPVLELLARFDSFMPAAGATATLRKLADLLNQTQPDQHDKRRLLTLVLRDLPATTEHADQTSIDALQAALESRLDGAEDSTTRQLLEAQLALTTRLPPERVQAVAASVGRFLDNGQPEAVRDFVEDEVNETSGALLPEAWLNPIANRLRNVQDLGASTLLAEALMIAGDALKSRGKAISALQGVLRQTTQPGWQASLQATSQLVTDSKYFRGTKKDLPDIDQLFAAALQGIGADPPSADVYAIAPLIAIAQKRKVSHQPLLDCVRACAEARNDRAAAFALQMTKSLTNERVLAEGDLQLLFDPVLESLRLTAPQAEEQFLCLIETLALLDEWQSRNDDVFKLVRDYSRPDTLRPPHFPSSLRMAAYRLIGSVQYVPRADARHEISNFLVEARAVPPEDEPLRRQIISTLAGLREAKLLPGRSPVWVDVRRYAEELGPPYADLATRF